MTSRYAVRLRGWGWRHAGRSRWAVRGVDLEIEHGERVLLLGPSGAGKSTVLLAIAGLLDPEAGEAEGELLVDGTAPREARDRTGLVMQDPESQIVMARVGDDVAFGLENLEVPRPEIWPRVDEALGAVGFPYGRDQATDRLSGGEQQRLVLAGTVALRPTILLLDEPTASLDPAGATLVRTALRRVLSARTTTLVLVEHRVGEVLDLVDRVVVLAAGGGVLADGRPGELFSTRGAELADLGVWVPGVPLPPHRSAVSAGSALLAAASVTFRYPGSARPAVSGVNVELRAGEALAVTGANGSGKSTLALMLAGLVAPTSGAVVGRAAMRGPDRPLHRWPADVLADRVGTVFQDPEHQFLCRTVAEEVALGPRRTGMAAASIRTRVDELLERLFLTHLAGANPFTLSGGEKRRLSVGTALATSPDVLILDEPTFGQDRRTWLELLAMLTDMRADGTSICSVTHDLDFAMALSDREVVVDAGRVVADHLIRAVVADRVAGPVDLGVDSSGDAAPPDRPAARTRPSVAEEGPLATPVQAPR